MPLWGFLACRILVLASLSFYLFVFSKLFSVLKKPIRLSKSSQTCISASKFQSLYLSLYNALSHITAAPLLTGKILRYFVWKWKKWKNEKNQKKYLILVAFKLSTFPQVFHFKWSYIQGSKKKFTKMIMCFQEASSPIAVKYNLLGWWTQPPLWDFKLQCGKPEGNDSMVLKDGTRSSYSLHINSKFAYIPSNLVMEKWL